MTAHVTRPDLRSERVRRRHRASRNLTFAYGDRRRPRRILVTIPAGQTVAIVGRTGSGKSTLLSLLARLHDPPPGTVFIDGIDVREMPLATLRGAIGFVPQEPFLFSDTIAENVAFGAAGGSRPTVRIRRVEFARSAAIARLDKDVAEFPERLRDADRRARHHAVRRAETAHRHCPRALRRTRAS